MELVTTAERHGYNKGFDTGFSDGFSDGFNNGFNNGEAHFFIKLLKAKFKELPKEYLDKINLADAKTLDDWGLKLLTANSLADVFI